MRLFFKAIVTELTTRHLYRGGRNNIPAIDMYKEFAVITATTKNKTKKLDGKNNNKKDSK